MARSFREFQEEVDQEVILWQDRKRYFGLPISFTKYNLTADRFSKTKGLFNTSSEDLLLYRIMDISVSRSFGQKFFGVGTLTIHARDKSTPMLVLENIKNPTVFARYLGDLVEKVRDQKRVTGREMFGSSAYHALPGDTDLDVDQDLGPEGYDE